MMMKMVLIVIMRVTMGRRINGVVPMMNHLDLEHFTTIYDNPFWIELEPLF